MINPKTNLIVHRPSRTINRVALSTAYSRVGKRKQATAGPSSISFTGPSPVPITSSLLRDPRFKAASTEYGNPSLAEKRRHLPHPIGSQERIFRPRCLIHVAAFNVRSLRQTGQQAALALTLHSLNIDVCCLSETRLYDASTVVELTAPSVSTRYFLRSSGDDMSAEAGQAGVGIVLSSRAEASLVDWIPVNGRLCAIRLETEIKVNANRSVNRCLFVIAAYAPTNCSTDAVKDEFYDGLKCLLSRAKGSDIVLLAGDLNAQVGRLCSTESELGGLFGLDGCRTDNGDRLLQLCADLKLYLSSTAFRHKRRQCSTWRPPALDQAWTQIDHIAVSYRWRGCIQDCRSFWSTYLDSDHALVRCRFSLRFPSNRTERLPRLAVETLSNPAVKQSYQSELAIGLCSPTPTNVDSAWSELTNVMRRAATLACGGVVKQHKRHWISERSLGLLKSRRQVPPGMEHNATRRHIRRELTRCLKQDREHWWSQKAEEMETAHNAGNIRKLFQLIRATGARKLGVSETICERDGSLIHNKQRRLARWAEYFESQFSWPAASKDLPVMQQSNSWVVNMEAPSEAEVRTCITALKRLKAAGPDDLAPSFFKEGGELLCAELTRLFQLIWTQETVPDNWGESIIVPIFKKGLRSDCANHRGISLTPVVSRLFASLLLRRLTPAREMQIREEQAGFRPGRGCIDHIFTLRQILEQRHAYRQPTLAVFLDFKGAFDSVDRSRLFSTLVQKGMPLKYANLIRALYAHTTGQVRVYGELSASFPTASGVRQGCPLSPFLFNFVIDAIMEECFACPSNAGVHVLPGSRLLDLDYADDIVLLFDSIHAAQQTLDRLSEIIQSFGMRFAPSKCKVLPQDMELRETPLVLQNEELEIVNHFTYLGSCVTSGASVSREIDARISKARLVFRSLGHLWRHRGISLHLKGRVYKTTVRAVLLYGCETWTLRVDDIRRLQVFDHRCLRSIAGVGWRQRVRNETVRERVLGSGVGVDQQINLHKLRWLGHVLRMPVTRLPIRALLAQSHPSWCKARGGQLMTWHRQMKALTRPLSEVGAVRLPGWGPRDSPVQWLETLQDMARNRAQWRSCSQHLMQMNV